MTAPTVTTPSIYLAGPTGPPASLLDIRIGAEPVIMAYYGSNKLWTNPSVIADDFNLLGFLWTWINQFVNDAGAGLSNGLSGIENLFSDGLGGIVDAGGNLVGTVAKFLPTIDTSSGNPGIILSQIPSEIATSICADLNTIGGDLSSIGKGGLIGLINGLPVIGGALQWVESLFSSGNPLETIKNLVGGIPVVGDLATLIGVVGDEADGVLADPLNFVVDDLGNVLGTLSCGLFQPSANGSDTQNVLYPIGVVGGVAKMLIPDGLVSLSTQTSTMRNQNATVGDNGWVQATVASQGDIGYFTQIWRRWTTAGTTGANATSGVGIDLRDGIASIVRRVNGVDTIVAPGLSAFTAGDVVHLNQAGNTHTLYINGQLAGQPWVDSGGTAHVGNLYRAVAMTMQGGQDLNGPRRFSPSLANFYAD